MEQNVPLYLKWVTNYVIRYVHIRYIFTLNYVTLFWFGFFFLNNFYF